MVVVGALVIVGAFLGKFAGPPEWNVIGGVLCLVGVGLGWLVGLFGKQVSHEEPRDN